MLVEDRLFATLDPTTRRLSLPGGEPVLLTDTVGFVRRLPHGLVEAFKSTLEVASTADFLVHVVDSAAPDPEGQIAAVREVLGEIDALAVPELLVFNKADAAPRRRQAISSPTTRVRSRSARATGDGIDELPAGARRSACVRITAVVELLIPYDRGDVLAAVHREGEVVSTMHDDDGVRVRARLADASAGRLGRVRRRTCGLMPDPTAVGQDGGA